MSSGVLTLPIPEVFSPFLYPSRYKAAYGGRGSTKSHTFAGLLLERHMLQPTRSVCVREIQNSLEQSVKRLLDDKIKEYGLGHLFHSSKAEIQTPHDGIIIFKGMREYTSENIKSLEGFDVAWVEEAQTFSEASMSMLRPTLRKPGSELWFSWNPRSETDPVDRFFRGPAGPPPRSIVVEASYKDNPWLSDELREEMEIDRRRSAEKYAHVWLGGYLRNSDAQVFKNWRIADFETPVGLRMLLGGDWGFARDPTVGMLCWLDVEKRQLFIEQEVYKVGCEIDDTPALFDKLGCAAALRGAPCGSPCTEHGHSTARRYVMTADSARPETISYLNRHGYPRMMPARKGPGSVEDGIAFLQNYEIIVHPRCYYAAKELTLYSYAEDKLTGHVLPELVDDNNHVIDSIRYAVEDARKPRAKSAGILTAYPPRRH